MPFPSSRSSPGTSLPVGAHLSIAGGVDRAVDRAREVGCRALQIFTKSSGQWRARRLPEDEVDRFRRAVRREGLIRVLAHGSYLINLASPDPGLRRRSVRAATRELERCESLGIEDLVLHPGAHGGDGRRAGVRRVARSLDAIHRATAGLRARVVLETAAGQGTAVGWRFEELGEILASTARPERLAFCFDTCHAFAAGYDLRIRAGWDGAWDEFERTVGIARLVAFHVNDSKRELGSRVDRHEAIGRGAMGLEPFRRLVNEPSLAGRPLILETPKPDGPRSDRRNLSALRGLVAPPTARAAAR